MAQYVNESIISSFSAKKYTSATLPTEVGTDYTPSAKGEIDVAIGDIVRFQHYSSGKFVDLYSLSISATSADMKVQVNDNSANPVFIAMNNTKAFEGMKISSIKFLSAGKVYFEGMTLLTNSQANPFL